MSPPLVVLPVAAALGGGLVALLLPLLRRGLLDRPNDRSAHRLPTPRGGGLAFVLVGVAGSLMGPAETSPLLLLCLPLALVGFLDDRLDLPAGLRYAVQLATALLLVNAARLPLPAGPLGPAAIAVLVVAVTAVINFVNFTDGLDGLVAGCMAVMLATAAVMLQAAWLWPLVGALLGFLAWNWSPARVFMGDVGSTFLGAVFSAVVLQQPSPAQALSLLLVGFPLLADALTCVLRRLAAGQAIFRAHRLHLFQRLHQAGWSHSRVAGLYLAATAALALARLSGSWPMLLTLVGLAAAGGWWLDRRVAVPFASLPG